MFLHRNFNATFENSGVGGGGPESTGPPRLVSKCRSCGQFYITWAILHQNFGQFHIFWASLRQNFGQFNIHQTVSISVKTFFLASPGGPRFGLPHTEA